MRKGILNYLIIAVFAISAAFTSCEKNNNGDDNGNNSTTGSVTVWNNYTGEGKTGNITTLYVLNPSNEKVIASGGAVYKGESTTISNIPEGTYSVQAAVMRNSDLVMGTKITTKTGVKVTKGKTTTVTFK
jgi:hypothetical protein